MIPLRSRFGALMLASAMLVAPTAVWASESGQSGSPSGPPGTVATGQTGRTGPGGTVQTPPDAAPGDPSPTAAAEDDAAQDPAADDASTDVEEVVVLGRFIPQPLRRTSEVIAYLGREDLERAGDDNAAGALTRLTGLSVVGGRFVYVRGLGERYSSALLNGSPLPSPEPLQRVIPLDLFPSNILASATVQKTYSPQFPGEFGGGVIDLRTLGVPREDFFSISASLGANSETTGQEGLLYAGGDYDETGFDDGTRDFPDALSLAVSTGRRIQDGNFTPTTLQIIGQNFVNAELNVIQRNEIRPNYAVDASGGLSRETSVGRFGVIGVFGFDSSWRTRRGLQQEGAVDIDELVVRTDYDFESTTNQITLNGLLGFGFDSEDHEVQWTNLYVHDTLKEARIRQGFDDLAGGEVLDSFTEWFERELLLTQLAGESRFLGGRLEVDWRLSAARASRDAPYERRIRYRLVNGFYLSDTLRDDNNTRFTVVKDDVLSSGIDFRYEIPLSSERNLTLLGGYSGLNNTRDSVQRDFRFRAVNALSVQQQAQRVDFLLSGFNIRPDLLVIQEVTGAEGAAAYEADLDVQAVYAGVDWEVLPLVRIAAGLRYEDATQTVAPRDLFGGPPPETAAPLENTYVLPAATITWNFAENQQIRLGASGTIARPQFRELAPSQFLDPDNDRTFIGNPFLTDSELVNLDARYEWYFRQGQFFTAGVFYKDIDRPVEAIVNEAGASLQTTFINAPRAVVYGAEFEIRTYFRVPESYSFFQNRYFENKRFFLNVNYTYTSSEVQAEEGDVVFPLSANGASRPATDFIVDGAPLQGQSSNLANLQFGYEHSEARSQATILLNYADERVSARGRPGQPDFVQDPGVQLDFTYRRDFTLRGQDFRIGLEIRNITGENFEEFQQLNDGRVDLNTYDLGTSASISLSASF